MLERNTSLCRELSGAPLEWQITPGFIARADEKNSDFKCGITVRLSAIHRPQFWQVARSCLFPPLRLATGQYSFRTNQMAVPHFARFRNPLEILRPGECHRFTTRLRHPS